MNTNVNNKFYNTLKQKTRDEKNALTSNLAMLNKYIKEYKKNKNIDSNGNGNGNGGIIRKKLILGKNK